MMATIKLRTLALATFSGLGLVLMACAGGPGSSEVSGSTGDDSSADRLAIANIPKTSYKDVCGAAAPGFMRCHAKVRTTPTGAILPLATTSGLGPSDITSAYNLAAGGGAGKTVAIVDAQDDPKAEADLAVYRAKFGLPACTTANGCFKKVSQTGSTTALPTADAGWAEEISLDLDMVSAACPECKILLVEANTSSIDDLGAAVNEAAKLGATVISNSYGGGEDNTIPAAEAYFNHPGIAQFVSAGDSGYGAEYPATSQYVFSVGGTALTKSSSTRGWAETAWSGTSASGATGSGCSAFVAKPAWQTDSKCAKRMESDLSAVADPSTGVAVYDSYGDSTTTAPGWAVFGGTSAASPIVASIFAKTGNGNKTPELVWKNTSAFYDVTSGSNGTCSGSTLASYYCKAGVGYDGPTGWGTPNGASLVALAGGSSSSSSSGSTSSSSGSTSSSSGSTSSSSGSTSSSSSSSGSTSSSSSSSGGTGTCTHSPGVTGKKLSTTCDACATEICDGDSYCCTVSWDSLCVKEAKSQCTTL